MLRRCRNIRNSGNVGGCNTNSEARGGGEGGVRLRIGGSGEPSGNMRSILTCSSPQAMVLVRSNSGSHASNTLPLRRWSPRGPKEQVPITSSRDTFSFHTVNSAESPRPTKHSA